MGKKALLVGCNYPGTKAELKGCVNDVKRMHTCLIQRYGFSEENIKVLIDTDKSFPQPTGKNIRKALYDLVKLSESGDFLFFHYSGHGTRLPAETGEDDDTGYDECIVPSDMNLITDDDFREIVDQVPEGCLLTIVSDSCHSGGLINNAKEQIGNSTKHNDTEKNSSSSSFGFRDFLKETIKDEFESRGIHIRKRRQHTNSVEEEDVESDSDHKNRSLPLSMLIDILKQKTGKNDIDVGKIRPTLFTIFGEDSSPKVKKFMKFLMNKLDSSGENQGGGFISVVGNLAMEFLKQKLDGNDEIENKHEVYAGSNKVERYDNGILISGCQSNQTSADANPKGNSDNAYGALSNAIQTIIAKSEREEITNKELVLKAREVLKRQGFTQQPGLYCGDYFVDAPFIC